MSYQTPPSFSWYDTNCYRVAPVMEKSWNFWKFEIFWNIWKSHGNFYQYSGVARSPTNMYVDIEVMEFCDKVMEKSWIFVAKIPWQPCAAIRTKSAGISCFLRTGVD